MYCLLYLSPNKLAGLKKYSLKDQDICGPENDDGWECEPGSGESGLQSDD